MRATRTRFASRYALLAWGLVLALLVASFGVAGTPAGAQDDVCPPVDEPVDPGDPSVIVDSPAPGDEVTSPVPIQGQARVFEATVSIIIYGEDGAELANTFTTAAAGAPELAPFATQVVFNVTQTQDGCIWVFEASAQDGSPRNVVAVPVTLLASDEPPGPAPTGDAGIGSNASALVLALTIIAAAWVVIAARVSTGTPHQLAAAPAGRSASVRRRRRRPPGS